MKKYYISKELTDKLGVQLNEDGSLPLTSMNCLTFGYMPWRYPGNWFRNIRQFFRTLTMAWQRITRGYCYWDLFSIDYWHSNVMARALLDFKENAYSYPGKGAASTPEGWVRILEEIALNFWACDENNEAFLNEYEDVFHEVLDKRMRQETESDYGLTITYSDDGITAEGRANVEKWRDRFRENEEKRNKCKNRAMAKMQEWYYHLWD